MGYRKIFLICFPAWWLPEDGKWKGWSQEIRRGGVRNPVGN
jgi:hypothetical protein